MACCRLSFFRPDGDIPGRRLRSYLRQRAMLVEYASHHIQHMQKALTQMNVKLQHVPSATSPAMTGMAIIEAIVSVGAGPAASGETPRPPDQGGRGNHRPIIAGPLARRAHLRADPGPGAVPATTRRLLSATGQIEAQLERFEDVSDGGSILTGTAGGAVRATHPASISGHTCIG